MFGESLLSSYVLVGLSLKGPHVRCETTSAQGGKLISPKVGYYLQIGY